MILRPPISTRTATLVPDTTLFRSTPDEGRDEPAAHDHLQRRDVRRAQARRLARLLEMALADVGEALGLARLGAVTGDGRSEEHTSELQSLMRSSYAVFCLKNKINIISTSYPHSLLYSHTTLL